MDHYKPSTSTPSSGNRLGRRGIGLLSVVTLIGILSYSMFFAGNPLPPTYIAHQIQDDGTATTGADEHSTRPEPTFAHDRQGISSSNRTLLLSLDTINPSRGYAPRSPESELDLHNAEKEVGFVCPPFKYPKGKSADSQTVSESIHKYSRYTRQYCNTTGVLQMQVPFDFYTGKVLTKIASMVGLKSGHRILDFGSGCGTMLNYYHLQFNTTGLGIDVTEEAVRHAMSHRQPKQLFCLMNAETQLVVSPSHEGRSSSFPSQLQENSFDAIVSWGVLHHIRRSLSQCMIVHNLVKLLKPDGKAYIGHLRHDKNDFWRKGKCKINGTNIKRMKDGNTFKVPHWKKYDFASLYIHKLPTL